MQNNPFQANPGAHKTYSLNNSAHAEPIAPHQDPIIDPNTGQDDANDLPDKRNQKWIRFGIFLFCLIFLVVGRSTVPDNEVPNVVDKLMDMFNGVNEYVLARPALRDGMLIGCSLFMDIMFMTTGAYWILYGKTSRMIMATLIFYFTRAAVQQIWYSPYPKNYFWDYPGFPSFVVPYGRSSDFFFSGHIGFVVINASEWVKNKKPWAATVVGIGGVYTAFILLVYQAHYSIDIFTGIICASWVFIIVDMHKEKFVGFFVMIYLLFKDLINLILDRPVANENQSRLLEDTIKERGLISVKAQV